MIIICRVNGSGSGGTPLPPDVMAALAGTEGAPADTNRFVTDSDIRLQQHISNLMSSRVVSGCFFRPNALDSTRFDIYKGPHLANVIEYVDNFTDPLVTQIVRRTFDDMIGVVATQRSAFSTSFVALDARLDPSNPSFVVQQPGDDFWTYEEFAYLVQIGSLIHSDKVHITNATGHPYYDRELYTQIRQFWTSFGRYNDSGNLYSASIGLMIKKSAGYLWAQAVNRPNSSKNVNLVSFPATFPYSYLAYAVTGSDGVWTSGAPTVYIDPNHRDTLHGSVAVSPGAWTVQCGYLVPDILTVPFTYIQYGQKEYADLPTAIFHYQDPCVFDPSLNSWAVPRFWLIVKQGTTNLNDPTNPAIFIEAPRFGGFTQKAASAGVLSVNSAYGENISLTAANIPEATNLRYLSDTEKSALDSANAPTGLNPFATRADIPNVPPIQIVEADSAAAEAAAYAAGAAMVIRTDLL